ncbi:MAG: hypothetical protein APF77_17590 [Clostridia bacterium BRH_c25]|nr:MAG: hypothetical protein APF77_17590 [Clostridia bacterium BRH_c25]
MDKYQNKGGNTAIIKKNNLSLIVRLIREMGVVSRTELSRITDLSKGGLTPIIQELIEKNVIRETGVIDSAVGRKPIVLEINSNISYVIAVDINRSKMQIGLVNFTNQLQSFYEYKYAAKETAQEIVKRLKSMIRFFIDQNQDKHIAAIAVSVPGPLNYQNGIILNPPNFEGWENLNIKALLEEEFGISTILDKDANAYAMAEKTVGLGKKYKNFIHITHCEGVGSGIVLNDKLYRGVDGFGTEIGHIIVDFNGKQCDCGNKGCLEKYASMNAIIEWIESKLGSDTDKANDPIRTVYERSGRIEWDDVIDGLAKHVPICLEAMENAGTYLAYSLVSMINIFAPEAIIIGGPSVLVGKYLLKPIKKIIAARSFFRDYYLSDVLLSELKDGALIGIAGIAFEHLLNDSIEILLGND